MQTLPLRQHHEQLTSQNPETKISRIFLSYINSEGRHNHRLYQEDQPHTQLLLPTSTELLPSPAFSLPQTDSIQP